MPGGRGGALFELRGDAQRVTVPQKGGREMREASCQQRGQAGTPIRNRSAHERLPISRGGRAPVPVLCPAMRQQAVRSSRRRRGAVHRDDPRPDCATRHSDRCVPIPQDAASPSKRRTTCYRWLPRRVFVSVPAPFLHPGISSGPSAVRFAPDSRAGSDTKTPGQTAAGQETRSAPHSQAPRCRICAGTAPDWRHPRLTAKPRPPAPPPRSSAPPPRHVKSRNGNQPWT